MSDDNGNNNTARTPSGLKPPWPKGQSGNPKGRPKGAKHGPRARLRKWLNRAAPEEIVELFRAKGIHLENGADMATVIVEVLGRKALNGEDFALKMIFEQVESPMPKQVRVEGNPDRTIEVNIQPVRTLPNGDGSMAEIRRT